MKAPDSIAPDKHVEDVFAVRSLAAGLVVKLGIGHTSGVAKQVLPHRGGGYHVRLPPAIVPFEAAQDIRLAGSCAIPSQTDVVVGQDGSGDGRVVFHLRAQILFFQLPKDFKVSLLGIGRHLVSPTTWHGDETQEQDNPAPSIFRLQLRAKRLHDS